MLLDERSTMQERMDDPSLDPGVYAQVLSDLARINALTLAYRPTLSFVARATAGASRLRLLDVGFGHGDMLRRIAAWCANRGLAAQLVGIDLNPNSAAVAAMHTPAGSPISYRTGDYAALGDEEYDVIVSSLVAHHMTRDELLQFLSFMDRSAKRGWFVNDLRRSALAWLGFPLLARAVRAHPIVRQDGTTSIARAFRTPEWTALLDEARVSGARVRRYFPFRLCVQRLR